MCHAFKTPTRLLTAAAFAAVLATTLFAQTMVVYKAQPNSKVRLEGTSTIHDWTIEGKIVGGELKLDPSVTIDPSQKTISGLKDGKLPAEVFVRIPVRTLKSGTTKMDNVMLQAFKADQNQYTNIEYRLIDLTLKEPHAPGSPFQFQVAIFTG